MFNLKQYAEKYTKEKKNVYIIPSINGFKFVGINFFLFLIAVSYSNNMALLISFIMAMFFILQMFSTHRIINSIDFENFEIKNQFLNLPHFAHIKFKKFIPSELQKYIQISIQTHKNEIHGEYKSDFENILKFKMQITKRGHYHLKRIKFFTYGPANLFYVWRYYNLDQDLYIYPEKLPLNMNKLSQSQSSKILFNESEFSHHIRYQKGLSTKRIDWKVYAKTDQLYWKKYIDFDSTIYEVNFNILQSEKEIALQQMSYLIDKYHIENKIYKVILPDKVIPASKGKQHFNKSMESISAY